MFYKVIRNKNPIDILDKLVYVKYQKKHNILLLCEENEAQGILSSDGNTAYHTVYQNPFPVDDYLTVEIEEITQHEYERLKNLKCMSAEDIIDQYTIQLINQGVI